MWRPAPRLCMGRISRGQQSLIPSTFAQILGGAAVENPLCNLPWQVFGGPC